jgi:hypothetical protein
MVRAHSAVEALGGTARHLGPVQLAQLADGTVEFVGLIYDLAPWNSSVVPLLGALRKSHPGLPILLFPPSRPEVSKVLLHCADLSGVRVERQGHDSRSLAGLQDNVQLLLASVYAGRLMHLVKLLLPDMPAGALLYLERILDRIAASPVSQPLSVGSIVAEMRMPLRTLQHALESAGLPSPKVLLDWLTLLYSVFAADASDRSATAVAKNFGLDAHRFARVRRRLLHGEVPAYANGPAQEFDMTFLAFAEACRVSKREASCVLERTA